MIESPLMQEWVAGRLQKAMLHSLVVRFGAVPPELAGALAPIQEEAKLFELNPYVASCPSVDAFRARVDAMRTVPEQSPDRTAT